MVGGSEVKVATVEIEDNTATLPIGHKAPSEHASTPIDKQTLALRDMEMRGVQPKPAKRYTFSITIIQFYHYSHNF